jgi:hypothetical protein
MGVCLKDEKHLKKFVVSSRKEKHLKKFVVSSRKEKHLKKFVVSSRKDLSSISVCTIPVYKLLGALVKITMNKQYFYLSKNNLIQV